MATRVGTIRGSRGLILWLRLRTGLNLPRTTIAVCAWALLLSPICAGQTASGPAAVRVGSSFITPQKVKDVPPVYPNAAKAAGVEGLIILELTITRDGMVQDVRVLRSIPLLDQAAIDAVKQWVYAPTLLNGDRVPVIVTVTVNFALPHYLVTSTPISSVGLSQPLCIAVNPKDPEGVWWWEPGAAGCSSRSTGPGVFRAESASVTGSGPAGFEVRFKLQMHVDGPLDVQLEIQDGRIWSASSPDASVQLDRRDDLDVPDRPPGA